MSTIAPGAPATTTPGRGSLLRAELHRFCARRFIRLLLVLGVLGLMAGTAIAWTQFEQSSPAQLVEAQQRLDEQLEMDASFREQCLRDFEAQAPEGVSAEEFCPVPTAESYGGLDQFIDHPSFDVADEVPNGAVGVGVVTAALLFLIGATYVGAEWSTRSMVALLFWEPRRLRVVATKALVAALAALVVAVAAQALWLAAGYLLGSARGTTDVPAGFWGDLLGDQARLVLLGVFAALIGFAATNLLRNTGATLGAAFFYLVVLENGVRVLREGWQEWLVTTNVQALASEGGARIFLFDEATGQSRETVVSNLQGGLYLGVLCLVLLGLGAWLFRRRDLH